MSWGGAGFEPRTTDLWSGALPLNHLSFSVGISRSARINCANQSDIYNTKEKLVGIDRTSQQHLTNWSIGFRIRVGLANRNSEVGLGWTKGISELGLDWPIGICKSMTTERGQ